MFLIKLAYKNLFRHWKRTIGTAIIIAMAIFVYLVFQSLLVGMEDMSYDNIIKFESGHLQVSDRNYWEEKDKLQLEDLITVDSELLEKIKGIEGFSVLSAQLKFQARLNNGSSELPVIGVGVNSEQIMELFALEENLAAGSFFKQGKVEVVFGRSLADLMDLKTGDYITLLVKTSTETFNTIEAKVAGLLETTNPNLNRNYIYLPLSLAQKALAVGNSASQIVVKLDNKEMAFSAKNQLLNILEESDPGLGVYSWSDLEAAKVLEADQAISRILLVIIMLIGAVGVVNTVILSAQERMKEIGMMKAQGMTEKEIIASFVLESTGIGLIGVFVGSVLGAVSIWYMVNYGMDFSIFMQGADLDNLMGNFGFSTVMEFHGAWTPGSFIIVTIFGILVSVISSIFPAWWVAKKDVVDAIYNH